MVPREQVVDCMFCGHAPCICNRPAKAKPKLGPRKAASAQPAKQDLAPTSAKVSGDTEVGPTERPSPSPSGAEEGRIGRPNLASVERVRDPDTELLAAAVTLFAERDMLGAESLREHRDLIRLPASRINLMTWREENKDAKLQHGR